VDTLRGETQVGDAADGREAFERGVPAVMVVHVEPGVKGGAAFCLGGVVDASGADRGVNAA
jgi:hypothetical protein